MGNEIKRPPGEFGLPEKSSWAAGFFKDLKKKFGDKVLNHFAQELLDSRRLEPQFIGDPNDRTRLHSENGIIFANHPRGTVDAAIILKALQDNKGNIKPRLKMMVLEESYRVYKQYFGDEHVVPASSNPKELVRILGGVAEHVNGGGSFFIFPEKWEERNQAGKIEFENGLGYLMAKLDPERMAYTFSINPIDVNNKDIEALGPGERIPVKVLEKYSTCGEWQQVMAASTNRKEQSQALAAHYFDMHKTNLRSA